MTDDEGAGQVMLYKRFEDLPVWNDAINLIPAVHGLIRSPGFPDLASLSNQLEPATLSISNNIAEGFERGTHEELLTFLYIARGSSGEVRSMLAAVLRLSDDEGIRGRATRISASVASIGRQLGRWIESIKDSPRRGSRYQTSQAREQAARQGRSQAYAAHLQRIVEDARKPPAPPDRAERDE